jgi:5-methyltetrahydropteroyltriglutamate--homocysteine methyltransferase
VEIGIDVVSDGEYGKPSFVTYMNDRLGGFERDPEPLGVRWGGSREVKAFPEFYAPTTPPQGSGAAAGFIHMMATGPVAYTGRAQLERDIANLRSAIAGLKPAEVFVPAISTSNIEAWHKNRYYKSQEEYLYAIADAMHEEYKAIVDAGFLLQIDDPIFATYYVMHPELDIRQVRKWMAERVAALNHALRGIPEERVRYHTCYSINMGPRVHDMELKDIVDLMLRIKAGAYSFEASNPRHEHEWQVWENVKLPPGKSLVPGVISHTTVLVEHPELVAQRIARYASVVGRENVIAGADCGFGTFATSTPEVHQSIVWEKFKALVAGARIASKQLWAGSRRPARKARGSAKRKPARTTRPARRRRAA